MAIVFASISGIAGREAISNFVHRFIVPRTRSYGQVYQAEDSKRLTSSKVHGGIQMAESHAWQKIDGSVKTTVVARVDEVHDV